ncbi:hypothetical protein ACIPY5_19690 [Microbacterium sp. NPDC089698]|uniref:hypothetical protein n=1 Tax=Microbacterium sp. NPDC089698 TaxID=3364200 RepID=UPI0038224326
MSESSRSTPNPGNGSVTRRTIVKGAAWSVPVIAAAATVPLASASTNPCTVSGLTLSGLSACGTATLDLTLKNAQGSPVPTGTVSVTLPAGLVWADNNASGARTITIVNGHPSPAVSVKSTGQAGSLTITAQGLTPCSTSATQAVVSIAPAAGAGRIFYQVQGGGYPVVNADPTGIVPNPAAVYLNAGADFLFTVTGTGALWYAWPLNVNGTSPAPTWHQVTTPVPMASLTPDSVSGSFMWGLGTNGQLYKWTSTSPNVATLMPSGGATLARIFTANNWVYGVGTDGRLYGAATSGSGPLVPITTGSPAAPVTNVTIIPGVDGRINTTATFIAGGKVYQVSGAANATAVPAPGLTNAKSLIHDSSNAVQVLDSNGALWWGTGAGLQQNANPALPPLDSFLAKVGTGYLGIAKDGRLIFWTVSPTGVQIVQDWSSTQFTAADIAEAVAAQRDSSGPIALRLENGDVWTRRLSGDSWVKVPLPGVTDADGSSAGLSLGAFAFLTDGSTTCP